MTGEAEHARQATCVFFRAPNTLEAVTLGIPTGLAASIHQLKIRCTDFAQDNGYSHWAQPVKLIDDTEEWLIYTHERQVAVFRAKVPTRVAAEMWMIHRGN